MRSVVKLYLDLVLATALLEPRVLGKAGHYPYSSKD